ncbi:MAG: glycosyltransferase [Rickettsiales bacterium]|jgi:glycosyltransferase involved in cell wall biosynthesis|nr:glycosyltransferase [Rickettsiales bacterium]
MPKKNVLFVIPTMDSGGVEVGMLEFARMNFERKELNIFLLSSGGSMISRIKNFGVEYIPLNVKTKNPIKIFKNIEKIKGVILEKNINIVQVESRAPAWSCYYACRDLNIPLITVVQFNGLFKKNNFLKKIYNSIMFKGNPIVAVSNFVRQIALVEYRSLVYEKNFRRSIEIVHRGIDTNIYNQESVLQNRKLILQSKLKLPEDKIIITLPARFSQQKGQEYFLNVLRHIKYRNYLCLMVGDVKKNSKHIEKIKDLIYKFNLQEYIKIHDNIDDMPALYALSNIVVSPNIGPESFGRVSIEAQSMGKLFIGTATGATCETVNDGITGFLAPENNAREFAKILDRVINLSEEKKLEISEQSRRNVIENFSFDVMYNKMLNLYNKIEEYEDFGCWH